MAAYSTCRDSLMAFRAKRFDTWAGLHPGCTLEDVTGMFPLLNANAGTGYLGDRKVEFRMIVVEGYSHPTRAWFENETLLLLDADYPDISGGLPNLLQRLGEPEQRFDF